MRILHTMLRVGDLERSIKFYTEVLGMKLLRTTDRPDQSTRLRLSATRTRNRARCWSTYNYRVDKYELGTAYGHVAIGVPDVARMNGSRTDCSPTDFPKEVEIIRCRISSHRRRLNLVLPVYSN